MDILDHLTTLDSKSSCVDKVSLNNVPLVQSDKAVEGRLWLTLKNLAATEAKIYMFHTLIRRGLATNDVQSFSYKQSIHKKVNVGVDHKVRRTAMQSKLSDALAFACRLRQEKSSLKKRIQRLYRNSKSKGRRILADLLKRYRRTKLIEVDKAQTKIMHLSEKEELEKVNRQAPGESHLVLNGVNVFKNQTMSMIPEPADEPMICHDSLKFSKNELLVLARGPKFMVRSKLDKEEFKVELEKMVVKQKFSESEDDCGYDCESNEAPDNHAIHEISREGGGSKQNFNSQNDKYNEIEIDKVWEENAGSMVYNLKSKSLDLGNLRATDYKHNKLTYMPRNCKVDRESLHESRRVEMNRVFDRIVKDNVDDSNLSRDELDGIASLKKRVKDGSLIVATTDKSKKFALLTREQYIKSGEIHTQKDIEISHSQVKRIQNTVNDHTWWLSEITNCGQNIDHHKRMNINLSDNGEQVCSMNLLLKDHKGWQ